MNNFSRVPLILYNAVGLNYVILRFSVPGIELITFFPASEYLSMRFMGRPYLQYGIERLERIHAENENNSEVLALLASELAHRKTTRAIALRRKVEGCIAILTNRTISMKTDTSVPPQRKPSAIPSQISVPFPTHTPTSSRRPTQESERPRPPTQSKGPLPTSTTTAPLSRATPEAASSATRTLSAWTAIEVLSPQSYVRREDLAGGDRFRVVQIGNGQLPWERGERSRPNYRLYYQVILGSLTLEPAIEALIARYGDTRPERPNARGKAVLATVVIDQRGRLVDSPAIGVSSFGWGVTCALNRDLAELAEWSSSEAALVEKVERQLLAINDDRPIEDEQRETPITWDAISAAFEELVTALGLPVEWIDPPEFAIRSYVYFKDSNPPEPLLLNSFFLADLAHARHLFAQGRATENLQRYLGTRPSHGKRDLLQDRAALNESLKPGLAHIARWPGQGRRPLVLLQQAAVNLAFKETQNGGIVGVNGPPGTGKTTLLRDIVAGVVCDRALAMCSFDDPQAAFTNSGQRISAGQGWIHLHRLSDSIRGFEMVVASSNNKAVENVSKELPAMDAIAQDVHALRYFKTLSDGIHTNGEREENTWGLIAAVLGNQQNRSRFKQKFWWNDDIGMNNYLRVAAGGAASTTIRDEETGQEEIRVPLIVEAENPPTNHDDALARWRIARKRFLDAVAKCRHCQSILDKLYLDFSGLSSLRDVLSAAKSRCEAALLRKTQAETSFLAAEQSVNDAAHRLQVTLADLAAHKLNRPGFWARLFYTSSAQQWHKYQKTLNEAHRDAVGQEKTAAIALQQAGAQRSATERDYQLALRSKILAEENKQGADYRLAAAKNDGIVIPDDEFFNLSHRTRQMATPWLSPSFQRARDDVFVQAMALHRAFIDCAAKPIRHNLNALMKVFTTQTLPGAEKQALLPDLWATLFLVVPLISTTFASVNRMLGKLPVESLGMLLIDEAGQAVPQAAVGAIMRTRKAVIVGDPLQIEPVVILPDTLTQSICRRFGVDPDRYAAPAASVQTLADTASAYTTEFQTLTGSRSVGVPLLVHRRCTAPMFHVSNAIAYANMMVSAKEGGSSPIRNVLGSSRWIDVQSSGTDKWSFDEGQEVIRLLEQLKRAKVSPDLYIVTPFVIVADRLRDVIKQSGLLAGWIVDEEWKWTRDRVGTVHTVQGREAEAVIFVLGAPNANQTGARGWAGGRPNLLNVAVTRAKEVLYVVGNRSLWKEAGMFGTLDKMMG